MEIFVTPLQSGEFSLQAAEYTFSWNGEEISGTSTDNLATIEVLTKREFILSSSWHSVRF